MNFLKSLFIILLMFGAFALVSHAQINEAETLQYERVIDGDTFVASGIKIRIWGIDAPEKDHPVSYAATLYLKTILEGGELTCEFVDTDRYQRSVMKCFVDNHDIASDLVRFGMATDFKRYSKGYYDFEETIAKKNSSGIWKLHNSTPI